MRLVKTLNLYNINGYKWFYYLVACLVKRKKKVWFWMVPLDLDFMVAFPQRRTVGFIGIAAQDVKIK